MTVTIHARGVERSAVANLLIDLAGGDRDAITNTTAGLVVSDALALAYLTQIRPVAPKPRMALVPAGVAARVRNAELASGLVDENAPKRTTSTRRKATATTEGPAT